MLARIALPPGRGAAHLEPPGGRYVYVVRSQRTGRVSIGVDLTPEGACTFACDYCQVAREGPRAVPGPIDLALLDDELYSALDRHGALAGDIAFAGSGEPTWSPAFGDALDLARVQLDVRALSIPVRVFTTGRTLEKPAVRGALERLVWDDDGEVWLKLDAWDEDSYRAIHGVRNYERHEERIVKFCRAVPVVLQVMLADRDEIPVSLAIAGIREAALRLICEGALIERVVLGTITRPIAANAVAARAVPDEALIELAVSLRAMGLETIAPAPRADHSPV
jgi:wyosine [tRNA(Phe)-imidazoG37] synthetase (radical SAM superfamily)